MPRDFYFLAEGEHGLRHHFLGVFGVEEEVEDEVLVALAGLGMVAAEEPKNAHVDDRIGVF